MNRLLLSGVLVFAQAASNASDHLDTAAVIADPSGDIGDLYAWSHEGRLNLVMTIVGGKFSDHVRYSFHIDSGRSVGATTASIVIECDFNSAFAPECRMGDVDRARGDASREAGLASEQGHFRVFAGVRDDPFFNNVRGTRAALNVAGRALAAGVPRDKGGCPRFDQATTARILDEWRHTEGHAGANLLAGWKTAALVVSADLAALDRGGPLLGVWATTSVRAAPPNHPLLDAGVIIDRMGRALTGNALLGTFDTEEASDRRKQQYNQATRADWPAFAAHIATTLAIYDGFDGVCGNQWLAVQRAAPETRYVDLAKLLADDRLWVNSAAKTCKHYLAAELHHAGATNRDCGGRTPNHDAVDVFRSLLVVGRITGVPDGVAEDDRMHSPTLFPFLAAP
ncbi:MAG TPA: DUF4331 family protein [Steroidobacteraceae bacterium]|nr:DUF4331 family protein [Steroidobacteraceae bacterium]